MKAWELLKLLDEGKILQRVYNNDPECTKYSKLEKFTRTCDCCPKEAERYYFSGWGSYGLEWDHLKDVIENPHDWTVKE
jgi:hypothetical protein